MKLLFIFLQVFFLGNSEPTTIPKKPLEHHSIREINQLFEEANYKIKNEEVVLELQNISVSLNGSIIYADKGEIIYQNISGYKSLNKKEPLTTFSLFDLASISKQFTAAAILLLASHDSLSLDDLIVQYLPTLPFNNVTIKNLLNHTSGLPEYFDYEKHFRSDTLFTNQMLIHFLSTSKIIKKGVPNTKFEYINTNYALLASIIEIVTGQKFTDYVRANLLIPAGMTNTYFYTELSLNPSLDLCKGHLGNGRQETDNILNSVLGDKSMFSTADDLFKWYKAFYLDYKILPKKWVNKAMVPQNKVKGVYPKELYGYGFRIEEHPLNRKLVYHGGLWRGFHHIMTYRPDDNKFLLFLSNYRNRAHNGKTNIILGIIDGA